MQASIFEPTHSRPIPETFIDYVDYWLDAFKYGEIKDGTYNRLLESRRVLTSYNIAERPVHQITFRDVKAYLGELVEYGYALTTVKKQLSIVTAPLKFAAANHWIPADPTVGIRIPSSTHIKKPAKEIVVFEGDSYDKLRAVLETEAHDAYCAALLMIEMGLRPGEAIALDWDDVLWNKKAVHIRKTYVRDTKTGGWFVQNEPKTKASNRIIPMSTYAHDMLERLYEKRGPHDSCVFRSVDGVRMSYESLRYQIARACEKANVSYEGMHVFRHTFATRQYYKGTSVKILSKLLGHASVTVTYNVYIHLYGDALDEMRSVLD